MAIRWDKLTLKAQEAVQRANDLASEHGNPELQPAHLLLALVEDTEGMGAPVLEKIGASSTAVQANARALIERLPKVSGGGATQANLSANASKVLESAFKEAERFKDEFVSTEHLLLAIADGKDEAAKLLAAHGATRNSILKALTTALRSQKVT